MKDDGGDGYGDGEYTKYDEDDAVSLPKPYIWPWGLSSGDSQNGWRGDGTMEYFG